MQQLGERAFVLRGFASPFASELIHVLDEIQKAEPFRRMVTPGGFSMSVALTNCGDLGWTTDKARVSLFATDPQSGLKWPPIPEASSQLAESAATESGFPCFVPDACLVNQYVPGAKLSLHQDKDEQDYNHPIVSVSLGIPAVFLFGGNTRAEKAARVHLIHDDVVVWGGTGRLRYHGAMPLKDAFHPQLGARRINFTFRRAGKQERVEKPL